MIHYAGTLGFGNLASLAGDESLFAATATEKLERLQAELQPLAERYDVVVANPPYMGGSNMNKWISAWVKNNYANAKRDLCTCFVDRGFGLANDRGHISMITASSWMFISSFEEFRKSLLRRSSITSMIQQSTHGYAGVTVPTTMFVLAEGAQDVTGTYIRLEDFDRPQWQEPRALEALANPNCGWAYLRDANGFNKIPGSPIAYWSEESAVSAFSENEALVNFGTPKHGMSTGNNDVCLRQWFEVEVSKIDFSSPSLQKFDLSGNRYAPYNKGGEARKWYGNDDYVIAFDSKCREKMQQFNGYRSSSSDFFFRESLNWSDVTSGTISVRYSPDGFVFDGRGASLFCEPERRNAIQAFLNSTVASALLAILNSSVTYNIDNIASLPYSLRIEESDGLSSIVDECVTIAKRDWNCFETSWNFDRHPLV